VQVKDDVQQVFDSGYFDRCQPKAEDTRDGVKLIIEVRGYWDVSHARVLARVHRPVAEIPKPTFG